LRRKPPPQKASSHLRVIAGRVRAAHTLQAGSSSPQPDSDLGSGASTTIERLATKIGNSGSEIRRKQAAIQGGERAQWLRLARPLAIADKGLTCKGFIAYH
jgi:hypothetical protein